MKIRTDFVTNSSSYCTTEVIIDNPVLLEILLKYRDMGIFKDNEPIIGIGNYESADAQFDESAYQNYTSSPAFFYFEGQNDEGFKSLFLVSWIWPESLDNVLECIISIMDSAYEHLDEEILTKLKEDLDHRKDEINHGYSSVFWRSSGWWDDGESDAKFKFDTENGSSFVYKDSENTYATDIVVENPLLLEILQKYKVMGLFGDRDPIVGIGVFHSTDQQWMGYDGPDLSGDPAFYYYERESVRYDDENLSLARFCPQKFVHVLRSMILIMENGVEYLDEKVFGKMKEELLQREDEIDLTYSRVYWYYFNEIGGEEFEYDPINGESYLKREIDQ